MLRQEVNLYHAIETPRFAGNFLTWKWLSYCQLFMLAMLCAVYVYSFWHVHHLIVKKQHLQTQVDSLEKKFIVMKEKYPSLLFNQGANQIVGSLQKDFESQKKMLRSLTTPIPFSNNFVGLSSNIVPNVWLTAIAFLKNGNIIILKGKSLNMETLQKFIGNMLHDTLFSRFSLNVDDITRSEKDDAKYFLSFQLSLTNKSA